MTLRPNVANSLFVYMGFYIFKGWWVGLKTKQNRDCHPDNMCSIKV